MRNVVVFALASTPVVAFALWLMLPSDFVCLEKRIENSDQAISIAKSAVFERRSGQDGAGKVEASAYIKAIEQNPNCCSAYYGEYAVENVGRGWSVRLDAIDLPARYEHIVNLTGCGHVIYNGGLSWKGVQNPDVLKPIHRP